MANVDEKDRVTWTEVQRSTHDAQHGTGPYLEPASPLKNFSLLSTMGLAFAILNSYTAMGASLSVAVPSGGPTAVIWGILISFIGNLAMAASLGEICHVYPTSGGQYHFSAILSTPEWAPITSYYAGWMASSGWVALIGANASLGSTLITGAIALANPSYSVQPYQTFLIYLGFVIGAVILNVWLPRILPRINEIALIWSLIGCVVIIVAVLSVAGHNQSYQPPTFVFATFINQTGWPSGIAWILGLLQSSFGLTAFDAVMHMVEEISPNPHIIAPKAMVLSIFIGSITSFIFLVALLFSINDVDSVISSPAGALLASLFQATGSVAGAIVLLAFPLGSMAFAIQGVVTATSRMLLSFARDGGLPFSPFFARTSSRGVPDNAIYLSCSLMVIFGIVYLGNSSVLNAILSSSVVFLNISYSIPIAVLLFRGRHLLRPPGFPEPTLQMGPVLGTVANIIGLVFMSVTTVFFLFPPDYPVTGSNMNYASAVLGLIVLVSSLWWIFSAGKNFTGPKNLGGLLELARVGIDAPKKFNTPDDIETVVEEKEDQMKVEIKEG